MPILNFIAGLFVTFIYQPFFNILVFFYWLVDQLTAGNANMGIAVILLAIVLRLLLLPLAIKGMRTEHEKFAVAKSIEDLEAQFSHDPVALKENRKALLRKQPKLVAAEVINLTVQIIIALMVWRMFGTGLEGKDLDLIYPIPFLQAVPVPFNLEFLGHDLGLNSLESLHNISFVLISILLLFIMETLSVIAAIPGSISRERALKAQIVIPIISFFLFLFMPAGKVLFLITTFTFSIFLTLYKVFVVKFELYKIKQESKPQGEQVLVETK